MPSVIKLKIPPKVDRMNMISPDRAERTRTTGVPLGWRWGKHRPFARWRQNPRDVETHGRGAVGQGLLPDTLRAQGISDHPCLKRLDNPEGDLRAPLRFLQVRQVLRVGHKPDLQKDTWHIGRL